MACANDGRFVLPVTQKYAEMGGEGTHARKNQGDSLLFRSLSRNFATLKGEERLQYDCKKKEIESATEQTARSRRGI